MSLPTAPHKKIHVLFFHSTICKITINWAGQGTVAKPEPSVELTHVLIDNFIPAPNLKNHYQTHPQPEKTI